MGFLLIPAVVIIFLEGKLILELQGRIDRLRGSRHELKVENVRLRKEVENNVLKIDTN